MFRSEVNAITESSNYEMNEMPKHRPNIDANIYAGRENFLDNPLF